MGMLDKAVIPASDMLLSLVFLMGSRLVTFYSQLFEGFFRAKHKAAIAFNFYTIEGFFRIGIGVLSLLFGCNIVGYSLGQFIVAIVFNIIFAIIAIRNVSDLPNGEYRKDIAIFTMKKGLGFMLTPIWQSIYMQGSTFVVRIALGPVAVAVFNTVRTVCQSIKSVYAIVNGSTYPEIQIAYGSGDVEAVKKIYIYSIQFVLFVSVLGYLFLVLFGPTIYAWWTNHSLQVSNEIFYIFLLGIPLNAIWWTSGTVFRAINKPTKYSLCGLLSAVVATLITYILSYPLSLTGAAIGFVVMDLLMVMLTLPMAGKEINVSLRDLLDTKYIRYGYSKIFRR